MKARKPEILRGLIGLACTGIFSAYAFSFSSDAMASREAAPVVVQMPTSAEFATSERLLAKSMYNDPHADNCLRGQIVGGAEIHIAMNFPPVDRPATKQNPGLARAHAEADNSKDKVLVLESKDPTVWNVTGKPNAIILLGRAVIGDAPEGVRIFAPRFASGCRDERWVHLPKNWSFPAHQNVMDSLMDDLSSRFSKRASTVSAAMFKRPFATWRVKRGEGVMTF